MAKIKISSQVEKAVWEQLREYAGETDRNIGGLLSEAIEEYLVRQRVRPVVLEQLERSMAEHEELGKRLAE
jgi:hypothetical protein